ncbi:MAG TPA: hypothetical protein VLE96_00305 [Chlamydiales bacterium]|nr:hypothetical protein [Chlamydiales bacterium]
MSVKGTYLSDLYTDHYPQRNEDNYSQERGDPFSSFSAESKQPPSADSPIQTRIKRMKEIINKQKLRKSESETLKLTLTMMDHNENDHQSLTLRDKVLSKEFYKTLQEKHPHVNVKLNAFFAKQKMRGILVDELKDDFVSEAHRYEPNFKPLQKRNTIKTEVSTSLPQKEPEIGSELMAGKVCLPEKVKEIKECSVPSAPDPNNLLSMSESK